jgi:hypothetical protein
MTNQTGGQKLESKKIEDKKHLIVLKVKHY